MSAIRLFGAIRNYGGIPAGFGSGVGGASPWTDAGTWLHPTNSEVIVVGDTAMSGSETMRALRDDASTNTTINVVQIDRKTSGLAADGIGGSLTFGVEADDGALYDAVRFDSALVDVTPASLNGELNIYLQDTPGMTRKFSLGSGSAHGMRYYGVGGRRAWDVDEEGFVSIDPDGTASADTRIAIQCHRTSGTSQMRIGVRGKVHADGTTLVPSGAPNELDSYVGVYGHVDIETGSTCTGSGEDGVYLGGLSIVRVNRTGAATLSEIGGHLGFLGNDDGANDTTTVTFGYGIGGLVGWTQEHSGGGSITKGASVLAHPPTRGDSVTATITDQSGALIKNQGAAWITAAVGVEIEAQSGSATNIGLQLSNLVNFAASASPTALGHLGMDITTGRGQVYVAGALRNLAHTDEVVTGPAVTTDRGVPSWNGVTGAALRENSNIVIDASGSLVPTTDNTGAIGTDALKWNRIRATEVVSGDYVWDDNACDICGAEFAVGDIVDLRVHKIEKDTCGKRLSFGVPVHRTCG